jgi:Asp-tRNA(Asn)/Glu-tRNA(Gln) amidotransferase A subunit family amidase
MSAKFEVEEATIAAIHKAFYDGTLTARALVQAYLDRVDAYDRNGPTLNSIVTINPNALAEADRLDDAYKKEGKFTGPMHGVPVLVKDQVETQGIMTTFGSIAIDGHMPERDATAISKLKAAGAIILAKTAMPDFATSWFGFSSKSGETRNPYVLERDPGGSSSGTGAAVAASLGAVGIGEDTGGSIRLPSSFNNLVGVRVTPGLVSRDGMSPLVVFQDTAGPMARTVTDAAILLDALVGYDERDPYTAAYVIAGSPKSFAESLDKDGLKGVKIGILTDAFGDDSDPESREVNKLVRAAIKSMEGAGASFVEISLPGLMDYIVETSLYLHHSRHDINGFLSKRGDLKLKTVADIHKAKQYHPALDLFELLVTGPEKPSDDPEYYRKLASREDFQRAAVNLLAKNGLTAMCFPCVRVYPPTKDTVRAGKTNTLTYPTNTLIAAQTWMPSICLPTGFTPEGIPVGMELVVYPYHEHDLFKLGYAYEQTTQHRKSPTSTSKA